MSWDNEGRHFYDQENDDSNEPLRRSKTPSFTDEPEDEPDDKKLRRHQAIDENESSFLTRFRKADHSEKTNTSDEEILSRAEQKKRDQDEENERKARLLGKKLNKVIWILIGLIIITYLIMRFVNF